MFPPAIITGKAINILLKLIGNVIVTSLLPLEVYPHCRKSEQWGSINIIYGTGFYTLNFPITFNSLYTIVDGGIFDVEIQSRNNSSFKIEQRSGQSSDIYCYIALGK